MLGKKRVLAIAGVACILVASLSVVYAAWTIDDMVDYMEKVGQAKIWKTCYLVTNDLKPKVDAIKIKVDAMKIKVDTIDDKMGQGLVGSFYQSTITTVINQLVVMYYGPSPEGHPKKLSVYINTYEMQDGDKIEIFIDLYINGWGTLDDLVSRYGSITKTFRWVFVDAQACNAKLIVDQLPVAYGQRLYIKQYTGTPRTISFQVIYEEV